MVTFPIFQFGNILSQKIEKNFGGYPTFGPFKMKAPQKGPPMTAYNPQFLIQNPFLQ